MKHTLVAICLLLISIPLFGQQDNKKRLTLSEAISIALQKNIDVIKAQNTLETQQAAVTTAYGDFLPSVSASAGFSRSLSYHPGGYIDPPQSLYPAGVDGSNSVSTSLSARVTLFDGFANTSGFSRATSNAYSAEYDFHRKRQDIVILTQTKYLTVLRFHTLLKVKEDNLKRSKQQLERIVESNKVGVVAIADVYKQQGSTASDELALIQAQNDYDNAKVDLQSLLSLNVDDDYEVVDTSMTEDVNKILIMQDSLMYSDYQRLVNHALEIRPDYHSAQYAKQSAESDVTIARSTYYPTISADASYSLRDKAFSGIANDKRSMDWGLTLSIPIFNGWQTSNAVQSAQIRLRNQEEIVNYVKRQVRVDVKKAMLSHESARKQIEVTEKNVQSAREERRIAEEKYNLGAGTLLDLLIANFNYTTAVSNKVNAAYDYLLSKQQLNYVIGAEKY
jgi:outer membrane protein